MCMATTNKFRLFSAGLLKLNVALAYIKKTPSALDAMLSPVVPVRDH